MTINEIKEYLYTTENINKSMVNDMLLDVLNEINKSDDFDKIIREEEKKEVLEILRQFNE